MAQYLVNSPALFVVEVFRRLQALGFISNVAAPTDVSDDNASAEFERVLSAFISETLQNERAFPFPVIVNGGEELDLLSLFRQVLRRGGLDAVTANGSWPSVAVSMGHDPRRAATPLKLIYFKYLDELSRRLGRVFEHREPEPEPGDGDDADVVVLNEAEAEAASRNFSSLKRKREPLAGMLNWLLLVARNPCDPSIGNITSENSGGESGGIAVGEMYSQALMARRAMFDKMKRQKIYPLTGEDGNAPENGQSRCRKLLNASRTFSQSDSNPENPITPQEVCKKNRTPQGKDFTYKTRQRNSDPLVDTLDFLPAQNKGAQVLMGKYYQAKVPTWKGKASTSSNDSGDSKWLGTQIWPAQFKRSASLIERDPVGKGRQDNCGCPSQGSEECVRFHVREKRNRLKLELGPVFYSWGFVHMGEEVGASWTEQEERRFRAVVALNPPSLRNLWQQLRSAFPDKGMKNLVSYYFNVFLLKRRSYQNRLSPENIDSD